MMLDFGQYFDPNLYQSFQMWIAFGVIAIALIVYATDRISFVTSSLGILALLLLVFQLLPVIGSDGQNLLGPKYLLAGFANPALIAILALLVIGEGLSRTGVLDRVAGLIFSLGRGSAFLAPVLALVFVLIVSGFLNNTPVVVIFIPVIQVLANQLGVPSSRWMMSLSFASILGGMITLIGSSTNLLVSGLLKDLGHAGFGFFDFTIPGIVVASVGFVYVALIAPRLTPERQRPELDPGQGGKQFIAQISVAQGSPFDGLRPRGGFFPDLTDLTIKEIRRGSKSFTPPFDNDLSLIQDDLLVIAATRKALTDTLGTAAGRLAPVGAADNGENGERQKRRRDTEQVIIEAMIRPSSRLVGMSLEMMGFRHRSDVVVLGIQRRSRIISRQMSDFRLAPGDILLLQGQQRDIDALRNDPDLLLIQWSTSSLPAVQHARRAGFIFLGVIATASTGVLPIVTAAIVGAVLMIASGVLNVRQAARAIDRTIVMLIATALALGAAMQATGGDAFLAELFLQAASGVSPAVALSAFFLLVAILANLISAKATAVLFTPISIGVAQGMGVDPIPFAVAVIFASNCGFATPVAYQTNLLVMGPGNYRFLDFTRTGVPLVIVVWATFSLFAPWYYGL